MFSREERFRDKSSDVPLGCIAHVDWSENPHGIPAFDKAERFKDPELSGQNAGDPDELLEKSHTLLTKKCPNCQAKAGRKGLAVEPGRAELEKEMKKLLAERSDLAKLLTASKSETGKLEGKLQAASKDKSSLQAHVASLHKENLDLTRGKKILQSKIDTESCAKKLSVTQSQLQHQLEQTGQKLNNKNKEVEAVKKQLADTERKFQESVKREREAKCAVEAELGKSAEQVNQLEGKLKLRMEEVQVRHSAELASREAQLNGEVAALKEDVRLLSEQRSSTQAKLEAESEGKARLQNEVTSRQEEIELLQKKVLRSSERVTSVEKQMASKTRAKEQLSVELAQKVETIKEIKEALRSSKLLCEEELRTERQAKDKIQAELSRKINCIGQLEGEIDGLHRDSVLAEKQASLLREKNAEFESRVNPLEEQVSKLKGKVIELTDKFNQGQEELAIEKNQNSCLETKCCQQESSLTVLEGELSDSNMQAKIMEDKLSLSEDVRFKLESKVVSQLERITKLEEQGKNSLHQEKEELVSERRTRIEVEGKLVLEEKRASKLDGDVGRLESSVKRLKEDLAAEKDAKKVIHASLTQEKEIVSKLKAQIRTREDSFKKCQEDMRQMQGKMAKLEGNLKSSKQATALKAQENGMLQRSLKELDDQVQHLSIGNQSLKREATEARSTSSSSLQSEQSLAKKCASYEKEIASQRSVIKDNDKLLQARLDELRREHQEAVDSLSQKCLTLEKELSHQKTTGEASKKVLGVQVDTGKASSKQQKPENETHRRMQSAMLGNNDLEQENERLKLEIKKLKSAYDEIEERYRPFQDQIDGLEELNHFLRNQTSSAQTEAHKLSEKYARLLGHQNQRQKIQHVKKLKDENAVLNQEIAKLKAEVTRHKRTIARMEEEKVGSAPVKPVKSKKITASSSSSSTKS